jgi:hypothetical protein
LFRAVKVKSDTDFDYFRAQIYDLDLNEISLDYVKNFIGHHNLDGKVSPLTP